MTEAELTEQILTISELVFIIVSVMFTVISAYIVGLYWFLRKTSLLIRLTAFGLFSFTTLVMSINGYGVYRHASGVMQALQELQAKSTLSALGQMALEQAAQNVTVFVGASTFVLALLIYLSLVYLTFFYRWPDQ